MCLFSVLLSLPEIISLYIWKGVLDCINIVISSYNIDMTKIVILMLLYFCTNVFTLIFNKINFLNTNIYKSLVENF